jgi:pimeloyl-ACP methyl ester carboxylesterase/acyl carrier protein
VIADTQGFADALADQLRLRGEAVLMTSRESLEFGRDPIRDRATTVIDCSALDASTAPMTSGPELVADITALCGGILRVVQRIVAEAGPARLWLLTRSAQAVNEPSQPSLRQAPVWGLGRVIAHEHSANWGGLVDLDPLASPSDAAKDVVSLLLANTREDQWAIRGGHPYAPRLVRYLPSQGVALALDSSTTYLITGGLGRIGLSLAEWLVRRGARHLALVSRRAEDSASKARLNGLRSQFRAAIDVYSADVADPAALQKVLRAIADSGAPLRGVIHCAGVLDDGVVLHQDESRLTRVLAAKAGGAWELHAQTAACDLQFFILCSSAAGLFGSPGQSNYAAANVFLDSLANWRRAAGLPGLSVQWGPWDIGMGQSRRNLPGVDTLDATTATAVLEQLLAGTTAEAAVLRANWPGLRSTIGDLPFLSEVAPQRSASVRRELQEPVLAKGSSSGVFAELMGVVDDRRPAMIRAYLESRIQAVIRASEPIGDTQRILDLGMDSLMIVEVLNECRRDLQIALYPREMYSLPNFGALAAYLAREFDRAHKAVETEAFPSGEVAPAKIAAAPRVQAPAKRNRSMVFLLSSPRAGSTLLRVMLAGHPLLFSPPELHLLAFDTVASWYRTLSVNDLNEGLERALMELMSIDAAGAQGVVQAMVGEDVAVYDVYAKLQELAGTRTLVDKSPTYGASIETLRRAEILFEEARYIHLVRHPHAVIESFVRNRMDKLAGIDTNDPYGVAEQAWVTMNRNIHQFFQEVDSSRCYLVRYEDLVTQPAPVLQKLCVFLNIPFDPALLQPYEGRRMTDGVHAHSYPIGDPSFSNHSDIDPKLADAWRSAKLPRVVGPEAQQLARTFGYSIETGETKSVAMRESWRDVRGARLCICEWGPEQGPIVLCLHGILEHGGAWELVAARLAGRGFHVIAPDLRGHGRSDHAGKGSSYHLLDFLADVDAIARSIGQPFRLVGHSMGTAIAAMFASSRPEQVASLVLVEPPSSGLPSNGAMSQLLAGQLDHLAKPQHHSVLPDVAAAAARLRTATPSFPLDLAEQAAIRLTEPCDGGVRWRWDAMLNTRAGLLFDSAILTSEAFGEIVRNIAAPTTLVYGDRSRPGVYGDGSRPGSEAAANDTGLQIPGARRVVLAGGHNLHIEAAADLADVIAGL